MNPPALTLLISSVGSLVGQNILDLVRAGQHPVTLVGLNSEARAVRNFHCARSYLVPPLAAAQAEARLLQILAQEQPQLILPGRDADVVFWAHFAARYPQWRQAIPLGPAHLAEILFNKALSADFCLEQGLPFARSLPLTAQSQAMTELGFPMIAKPCEGYGSVGVRILFHPRELEALSQQVAPESYLLQEWLGKRPQPLDLSAGSPLFWAHPEREQYASELIISPTGELVGKFSGRHQMQSGYCVYSERHADPAVAALVEQVAEVFVRAGWRGVLNLQYKPNAQGQWRIFEFNGRITGGASSRWHLGFDELGCLLQAWCGLALKSATARPCDAVFRDPQDLPLWNTDLQQLQTAGQWKQS